MKKKLGGLLLDQAATLAQPPAMNFIVEADEVEW